MKECKYCNTVKPFDEFYLNGGFKCKQCKNAYSKKWVEENKEKHKANYLARREVTRETDNRVMRDKYHNRTEEQKTAERLYRNAYQNKRKAEDKFYKLQLSLRASLTKQFKRRGWGKKTKTQNILGCSFDEFRAHLEKQFTPKMSIDNYAQVWEIDHIIPISSAKNENELYKLLHYSNCQPLLIKENREKSNRISNIYGNLFGVAR